MDARNWIAGFILSVLILASSATWGLTFYNEPSPSHWWNLDELSGTTAYDFSDDDDGAFSSIDEPNRVEGVYNGAVDFNGISDYFAVSGLDNQYEPIYENTFSVSGWFKTSQTTGKQTIVGNWNQYSFISEPDPTVYNMYFGWQVLVEDNTVVARFGPALTYGTYDITGTKTVTDGNWHHFVLVFATQNSNSILYVDGIADGTPQIISGVLNNTKFRIGDGSYVSSGDPVLKGGPFKGVIDDVRVYNSVLSAEDVNQLYYAQKPQKAFSVIKGSGNLAAMVDAAGNLLLKGDLDANSTPAATAEEEFRIKDSDNYDVAVFDANNGNVQIQGTLFESQAELTPTAGANNFIIKNASGDVVFYIDNAGNLHLKGTLYEQVLKGL